MSSKKQALFEQMKQLWEILVPTVYNSGKSVRTRHHKEWDKVVRSISGGLTIFAPVKGQWICNSTGRLFCERMIPVRIACTEKQIAKIAKFSIKHYKQLAIIVYRISDKVTIFENKN